MKKIFLISGALLIAFAIKAQDDKNSFEGWDANDDDKIDMKEYSFNTKIFDKWDENGDNRVSTNEFQNAFFGLFDSDSDDEISLNEFRESDFLLTPSSGNMAMDTSSSDQSTGMRYGAGSGTVENWDVNNDKKIDQDEFNKNITSIFNSWDKNNDNYISKSELYANTFSLWDTNSDGYIDKNEFDKRKDIREDESFFERIF